MSHLFISYKKEDTYQLRALISILKQENVPFWADIELEAGTGWREEIDAALEQSYALAVIITAGSMASQYVAYEWSWALGNGIPVIPLLFQPLPSNQIHLRLQAIQYVECYPNIPDNLTTLIKSHQVESPLVTALNLRIEYILTPLRVLGLISFWFLDYIQTSENFDGEVIGACTEVFRLFISKYRETIKKDLPEFWVNSSAAFPLRQRRNYELLVGELYKYYKREDENYVLNNIVHYIREVEYLSNERAIWRTEIEPLFKLLPLENENEYEEVSHQLQHSTSEIYIKSVETRQEALNSFYNSFLRRIEDEEKVRRLFEQAGLGFPLG